MQVFPLGSLYAGQLQLYHQPDLLNFTINNINFHPLIDLISVNFNIEKIYQLSGATLIQEYERHPRVKGAKD